MSLLIVCRRRNGAFPSIFRQSLKDQYPREVGIWEPNWLDELGECRDLIVEMIQDNHLVIGAQILVDGVEYYPADELKFGFQFEISASAKIFTLDIPDLEEIYQNLE